MNTLNLRFVEGKTYRRIRKYMERKKHSELDSIIEELNIELANTYDGGRFSKSVIICNELEERGLIINSTCYNCEFITNKSNPPHANEFYCPKRKDYVNINADASDCQFHKKKSEECNREVKGESV